MNPYKILQQPAVLKILRKAEDDILQATGEKVMMAVVAKNGKRLVRGITLAKILNKVCIYLGRNVNEVKAKGRKEENVFARHLYSWAASQCGFALKQSGVYVNGRDHTTILHGKNEINKKLDIKDPKVTRAVSDLIKILGIGTEAGQIARFSTESTVSAARPKLTINGRPEPNYSNKQFT